MKQYQNTIDWLYQQTPAFQKIGGAALKVDLRNIKALMDALDHPQNQFPSIHIAGTNGKGSSTHILAAIFQARGLKVGVYTSPHYITFRERIKINGEYIPENYVVTFVDTIRQKIIDLSPSFFEITVAMAFQYFADQQVDIAIIETGLGGRLDSTNIISPQLSLITNISFDHQQFLGNTLEAIASEKAGIIKPETPVVISEKQVETTTVFNQKASDESAPISFAEDHWKIISSNPDSNQFDIFYKDELFLENQTLGLEGAYQQKNLTGCMEAIRLLSAEWQIEKKHIKNGLENIVSLTRVMGRWQSIQENPKVIIDSGHNPAGIELAFRQLQDLSFSKLRIVFGMLKDRKLEDILDFLPKGAQYYLCQPEIFRAKPVDELADGLSDQGFSFTIHASVKKAYENALAEAKPNDLIFIGGSSFVVADALSFLVQNPI